MSKHTPEPWTLSFSPAGGFNISHDPRTHGDKKRGVVFIATVYYSEAKTKDPETLANLRLMAAAPKLLAALEVLVNHYITLAGSGDCGMWDPEQEPEVIAARTAITEAKGL